MNRRPLIIAHRGASARAPENTFAAFQKAIDVAADGIEFDVRLSRDGVPVVIHDETLNRVAGRSEGISDLPASELATIDVGSWFNRAFPHRAKAEYSNEKVKSLAETLEFLFDFRGLIYIELKCTPDDAEALSKSICSLVLDSAGLPRMIIKSFNLDAIAYVRRFCPAARTAALFEPTMKAVFRKQKNIIDVAKRYGADELSLHYSLATARLCKRAAEQDMPVTIWSVDQTIWFRRATERGIRAMICDDPSRSTI